MVEFQGLPKEVFDIDPELSDNIKYFCDEAQLPNVNTDTGSIRGMYPGLGIVDYAHTKVYTDLQLGFMCDANMTILKMLNAWHDYMFIDGEYITDHTYIQRPSKKNCKYCEFNQTEHCDVGVK